MASELNRITGWSLRWRTFPASEFSPRGGVRRGGAANSINKHVQVDLPSIAERIKVERHRPSSHCGVALAAMSGAHERRGTVVEEAR